MSDTRIEKALSRLFEKHRVVFWYDPTRAVILVTDTWDPGIISESIEAFRTHVPSAVPKVFVGLLVNGSQVTPQALV